MSEDFKLTQELMDKIDKIHPSPETLSQEFYNKYLLGKEITSHELTAFCVHWLGLMSTSEYPMIKDEAIKIGRLFYLTHYYSLYTHHLKDQNESE